MTGDDDLGGDQSGGNDMGGALGARRAPRPGPGPGSATPDGRGDGLKCADDARDLMAKPPGDGNLPHHFQETDVTCGPAAIKMILDGLLGIKVEEETLALHLGTNDAIGTRQKVIERFVLRIGLEGHVRHTTTTIAELRSFLRSGHAVLVCFFLSEEDTDHYALVVDMTSDHIVLHDPWYGPDIHWPIDVFDAHWFTDPAVPRRHGRWMLAIRVPTTIPERT